MQTYVAGNIIEQSAIFTADDNVTPIDPTTVQFFYQALFANALSGPYPITFSGASVPATNTIAKLSSGNYLVRVDTSLLPGYWKMWWVGQGSGQAITPTSALVYPFP